MSKSIRAFAERLSMQAGTWLVEKLVGVVPEGTTGTELEELEELGTSAYVHPRPGDEEE